MSAEVRPRSCARVGAAQVLLHMHAVGAVWLIVTSFVNDLGHSCYYHILVLVSYVPIPGTWYLFLLGFSLTTAQQNA